MNVNIRHTAASRSLRPAAGCARRVGRSIALLGLLVGLTGAARADEPISVESLNQLRPRWEALRGTTLQIEGRCLGFSESVLKMSRCDLVFVLETGSPIPTEKPKNVELAGSFETREMKLVFVVTRMKPRLSDSETVLQRRAGIQTSQPQQWYDLAGWVAARAAFYEDRELAAEAVDLNEKGLLTEYRQVAADGFNELYRLAGKVSDLKLPDRLRARLVHDAARRELAVAGRRRPPDFRIVATHILERLAGSSRPVPLDAAALELKERYQADPLAVYEESDDAARQTLHRFLYTEAALAQFHSGAAEDGSNGFKVAADIEQTLPEFADLAEQFRTREIEFQVQHVNTLSREQLLKLAERLAERQQETRAREVKERWLKSREAAYQDRGPRGQMDLAEEYDTLLGDRQHAARIVIDVYRKHAGADYAREKLQDWGYRCNSDGEWSLAAEVPQHDGLPDVVLEGRIQRGMTADQVRTALGQQPASIQRFASRGGVSELWIFRDLGVSVLLNRRQRDETRVVVDFAPLSPPGRP
jgi:hypothetical protein